MTKKGHQKFSRMKPIFSGKVGNFFPGSEKLRYEGVISEIGGKCIIAFGGMDAVLGQNGSGQNGTDKMVLDKMVWKKWYGQNGRDKISRIKS